MSRPRVLDMSDSETEPQPPAPKKPCLGDALPQDAAEFANASLDLDVIADQEDTPRKYVDLQAEMVAKLDATLEAWPDGATPAQTHALTIIAMFFLGKMIWDAKSDALLARVVGALSGDELRAHSDAIRRYESGAWRRLSSLPADLILRMEEALNLAKYLCLVLASNDIRRAWDPVMDFLPPLEKLDCLRAGGPREVVVFDETVIGVHRKAVGTGSDRTRTSPRSKEAVRKRILKKLPGRTIWRGSLKRPAAAPSAAASARTVFKRPAAKVAMKKPATLMLTARSASRSRSCHELVKLPRANPGGSRLSLRWCRPTLTRAPS